MGQLQQTRGYTCIKVLKQDEAELQGFQLAERYMGSPRLVFGGLGQ